MDLLSTFFLADFKPISKENKGIPAIKSIFLCQVYKNRKNTDKKPKNGHFIGKITTFSAVYGLDSLLTLQRK